jgi:WD40 repeat protein
VFIHPFELQTRLQLAEYITGLSWSKKHQLAVSSAAGEVLIWRDNDLVSLLHLETRSDEQQRELSIDCLGFSGDGTFLVAGGQDGLRIWQQEQQLVFLDCQYQWIDRLSWHPTRNLLAYSLGKSVEIWDGDRQSRVASLDFAATILDLAWRDDGEYLAIAGNGGLKIWQTELWDKPSQIKPIPVAAIALAWSRDNVYLASINLDKTLTVWREDNSHPWIMKGFSGKLRALSWSFASEKQSPVLAVCGDRQLILWHKELGDAGGWSPEVLEMHEVNIAALSFQSIGSLLASGDNNGWICLWQGKAIAQILDDSSEGISSLLWHPQGTFLAAGGQTGEVLIWKRSE